jgi:hypothetical protein
MLINGYDLINLIDSINLIHLILPCTALAMGDAEWMDGEHVIFRF